MPAIRRCCGKTPRTPARQEDGPFPAAVADIVRSISGRRPGIRFLTLWTYCFGGDCLYSGQVILDGAVIASAEADKRVGPLLLSFGVELGQRDYFAPLTRDFLWKR